MIELTGEERVVAEHTLLCGYDDKGSRCVSPLVLTRVTLQPAVE